MSISPTYRYLVENARTFYRMKEEMGALETALALAIRQGIEHIAAARGLDCVPLQEGLEHDEEVLGSIEGDECEDWIGLAITDRRLLLPSGSAISLAIALAPDELLNHGDREAVMVSLTPLSEHLGDLQQAKGIWSRAGLAEVFERDESRGWTVYTNNRKAHTFWGACVEQSLAIDLEELAAAWDRGEMQFGLARIDELLATYQDFAEQWIRSAQPLLGPARPRRRAG